MAYTIRPARPGDEERIAALEAATFPLPRARDIIGRALGDFLTVWDGETLCGYADHTAVLDEGYIGNIAVAPEHRRRGLGRALLRAQKARAAEQGLRFLTLEVRAGNTAARRLYESEGFETAGLRRDYYERPREDALLMTYYLEKKETKC